MAKKIKIDPRSFTWKIEHRAAAIITECGITAPQVSHDQPKLDVDNDLHHALCDTGCSGSAISIRLAEKLKLKSSGKVKVMTGGGLVDQYKYTVDIWLPNGFIIPKIEVTGANIEDDTFDILIGMSIIGEGDFAITNFNGSTCFSFRMPSMEHIDFDKRRDPVKLPPKIGRNSPCPCGSGKKFKQCCGKK